MPRITAVGLVYRDEQSKVRDLTLQVQELQQLQDDYQRKVQQLQGKKGWATQRK